MSVYVYVLVCPHMRMHCAFFMDLGALLAFSLANAPLSVQAGQIICCERKPHTIGRAARSGNIPVLTQPGKVLFSLIQGPSV